MAFVAQLLAPADNLQGLVATRAGLGVKVEGSKDRHLGGGRGSLVDLDELTLMWTREERHGV